MHGLLLRLFRTGSVMGLRIDHIDGLSAPRIEHYEELIGAEALVLADLLYRVASALGDACGIAGSRLFLFTKQCR
jgi:maltooligosyltrehalose synthase